MVDDEVLRKAEKVLSHLAMLSKSYGKIKAKKSRDPLVETTLQGGTGCVESVTKFVNDEQMMKAIETNAATILRVTYRSSATTLALSFLQPLLGPRVGAPGGD